MTIASKLLGTAGLITILLATSALAAQPAPSARPNPGSGERPVANQVTVTGSRPAVIDLPDRLSFNVANDLGAQTGSLADALRNVPGVEVDLQGTVSLRGDTGVTILVDGRPSAMLRGEGRGDALLAMPANQVERVEVMTNPSAAFSPEGSGGVINLITRKNRQAGTSGTIRANAGPKGRGSLNLNGTLSRPGLTVSADAGLRRFTNRIDVEQERERIDPLTGATLSSGQASSFRNVATSGNARLGVEHDLDKKNRVTADATYRNGHVDSERRETYSGNGAGAGFERLSDIDMTNRVLSLRSSWRRALPGKDHRLVAEVEADRGTLERRIDGETLFATLPSAFERIENNGERAETRFKLDYNKPLGEGRSLNLGYEGERSEAEFEFRGARGPDRNALLTVPGLTNDFDYRQTVHALFGTYQLSTEGWELQPALRVEYVDLDLDQRTDGQRFEQDYLRFYPTLHVGRSLSKRTKVRASYSRRIQRPGALDLNPYGFYVDPQNQRRGNPRLKPETTDVVELSWQYRKDATFLSLTGFCRQSRDGFTDIVEAIDGVLFTTRANLGRARRVGVDAIVNGRIGKKLNYNLSATVQHVELDADGLGDLQQVSDLVASGRANLTWQPTAKDYFQLNGNYSGRQLLPQGYRLSGGIVNAGYRRKVNERFSLLLTGQNIFDTAKQEVVIRTPLLRDRLEQRVRGRVILAGLSYNFGGTSNRKRQDPAFDFDPGATSVGQ